MDSPEQKEGLDESVFTEDVDTQTLGSRTAAMHAFLSGRIIGQQHAIDAIVNRFGVHYARMGHPTRPIGAFIFAGPTGVGKSMLAEELARCLIADVPDPPFTEIQGERYTSDHQILDLIGAPPSYVGFNKAGLLSQLAIDGPHFWAKATPALEQSYDGPPGEKVLNALMLKWHKKLQPYLSVILVDELEKADRRLSEFLLGMIDKGRLQMSDGGVTHFNNSVVIITCNIAGGIQQAALAGNRGAIGFGGTREDDHLSVDDFITRKTIEEIKKFWPSEFVGRLRENIIVFHGLDHESCRRILDIRLEEVRARLAGQARLDATVLVSERFKEFLLEKADYRAYGAREINAKVERFVTKPLSAAIESEQIDDGDELLFTLDAANEPVLRKRSRSPVPQDRAIVPADDDNSGTIPISVSKIRPSRD